MAKRALLVGINDLPSARHPITGCVNDALAWRKLLIEQYGFAPQDIKMLTRPLISDPASGEPTAANIYHGVKELVQHAASGDTIVFQVSSHGTRRRQLWTDYERDGQDEALVASDNLVIRDNYFRALYDRLPDGVSFTAIHDFCHSQSSTRLWFADNAEGRDTIEVDGVEIKLDTMTSRYIEFDPQVHNFYEPEETTPVVDQSARSTSRGVLMKEMLIAGCLEYETAKDVDFASGRQGAMSYYAIGILRRDPSITYGRLATRLRNEVSRRFRQTPVVEGYRGNANRPVFSQLQSPRSGESGDFSSGGLAGSAGSDALVPRLQELFDSVVARNDRGEVRRKD
ncbi:MAG: caspase family protein, partial [Planctomycetota bacterium]